MRKGLFTFQSLGEIASYLAFYTKPNCSLKFRSSYPLVFNILAFNATTTGLALIKAAPVGLYYNSPVATNIKKMSS